jgi:hypothetical protein
MKPPAGIKYYPAPETDRIQGCMPGYFVQLDGFVVAQVARYLPSYGRGWRVVMTTNDKRFVSHTLSAALIDVKRNAAPTGHVASV